ncbi:hypothetical protein MUK42_28618 [Musa troglodytarum]|uniref:Uncharacterized protein n=1 Tax=Musa troglodytarum TaxID=320322 RepID=A0A9E7K0F8_9LILI|nr:hypothetical protein MUK42_28618 [Musa troglodytarum]
MGKMCGNAEKRSKRMNCLCRGKSFISSSAGAMALPELPKKTSVVGHRSAGGLNPSTDRCHPLPSRASSCSASCRTISIAVSWTNISRILTGEGDEHKVKGKVTANIIYRGKALMRNVSGHPDSLLLSFSASLSS